MRDIKLYIIGNAFSSITEANVASYVAFSTTTGYFDLEFVHFGTIITANRLMIFPDFGFRDHCAYQIEYEFWIS